MFIFSMDIVKEKREKLFEKNC